jgi:hypothetical protein
VRVRLARSPAKRKGSACSQRYNPAGKRHGFVLRERGQARRTMSRKRRWNRSSPATSGWNALASTLPCCTATT